MMMLVHGKCSVIVLTSGGGANGNPVGACSCRNGRD